MYQVTSEIFFDKKFSHVNEGDDNNHVISKFHFRYPSDINITDNYDVENNNYYSNSIEVEHVVSSTLSLVGLQIWRGSLLLSDFLFHCRDNFHDKRLLEFGAGIGLTAIAAALHCDEVICTDLNKGGILELIKSNVNRNRKLLKGNVHVFEYDFMKDPEKHDKLLLNLIDKSDIVIAADVIYDTDITSAFVNVIDYVFLRGIITKRPKTIYIGLEKRPVFTFTGEQNPVAPMFEFFMGCIMKKPWKLEFIPLDFPQYFEYDRCKQLVLLKLTSCDNIIN